AEPGHRGSHLPDRARGVRLQFEDVCAARGGSCARQGEKGAGYRILPQGLREETRGGGGRTGEDERVGKARSCARLRRETQRSSTAHGTGEKGRERRAPDGNARARRGAEEKASRPCGSGTSASRERWQAAQVPAGAHQAL